MPMIMVVGSGSQLRPLSHELSPNQFIPLLCASMLLNTIGRVRKLTGYSFAVAYNEENRLIVTKQLRKLELKAIFYWGILPVIQPQLYPWQALYDITIAYEPLVLMLAADHSIDYLLTDR